MPASPEPDGVRLALRGLEHETVSAAEVSASPRGHRRASLRSSRAGTSGTSTQPTRRISRCWARSGMPAKAKISSCERVEDEIRDNAPGAAVADPANPAALSGDTVQIIPKVSGLTASATRASIPDIAGALQLGTGDSTARLVTVRFYNRGDVSFLPWPHDQNFVVDTVYVPSTSNPVTNAAAPFTLAGAASSASNSIGHAITIGAVIIGGAVALLILSKTGRTHGLVWQKQF